MYNSIVCCIILQENVRVVFPAFYTFIRHAPLPADKRAGRCFRKPIFGIFTNMRLPCRPRGYRNLFVPILFLAFIITVCISNVYTVIGV
jgi:hypothetical protein